MQNALPAFTSRAGSSLATVAGVIAARADLSFARHTLLIRHACGSFGEAIAQRAFLHSKLSETARGGWISIAPRSGRQGFDHLFLRMEKGRFKWIVGESKFGSSQLGKTDGKTVTQMSWVWIRKRALKLGDAYLAINKLDATSISRKRLPFIKTGVRTLDVPLEDGTKATFWKDSNGWHYDGPAEKIKEAQEMAARMGADLKSPSCNIRERLFRIEAIPGTRDVKVTIEELSSSKGSSSIDGRGTVKEIVIKDILGKRITDPELKDELAKKFRKEFPGLSDGEIREMVEEFCDRYKNGSLIKSSLSFIGEVALQSLAAGAVAGAFDVGVQLLFTRKVNWSQTGLAIGGTAAGAGVGQAMSVVFIKTKSGAQAVRVLSRMFGVRSASFMRNALSGNIGAVLTQAVVCYGSAWLGNGDWKSANRSMVAGLAGTFGGTAVGAGVLGTVMTFGTASTGTAISTLSGAAATNAAYAILGGGTIASGGGGAAMGAIVLGGIVVVAAVAISGIVAFAFARYDKIQDENYLKLRLAKYSMDGVWEIVAANRLNYRVS